MEKVEELCNNAVKNNNRQKSNNCKRVLVYMLSFNCIESESDSTVHPCKI